MSSVRCLVRVADQNVGFPSAKKELFTVEKHKYLWPESVTDAPPLSWRDANGRRYAPSTPEEMELLRSQVFSVVGRAGVESHIGTAWTTFFYFAETGFFASLDGREEVICHGQRGGHLGCMVLNVEKVKSTRSALCYPEVACATGSKAKAYVPPPGKKLPYNLEELMAMPTNEVFFLLQQACPLIEPISDHKVAVRLLAWTLGCFGLMDPYVLKAQEEKIGCD